MDSRDYTEVEKLHRIIESRQADLASVMRANSNKLDTIKKLNEQVKELENKSVILRATIKCHEHWQSEADQLRKQVKVQKQAIDALVKFGTTVAPSSSFWDEVWTKHEEALAATEPTAGASS